MSRPPPPRTHDHDRLRLPPAPPPPSGRGKKESSAAHLSRPSPPSAKHSPPPFTRDRRIDAHTAESDSGQPTNGKCQSSASLVWTAPEVGREHFAKTQKTGSIFSELGAGRSPSL